MAGRVLNRILVVGALVVGGGVTLVRDTSGRGDVLVDILVDGGVGILVDDGGLGLSNVGVLGVLSSVGLLSVGLSSVAALSSVGLSSVGALSSVGVAGGGVVTLVVGDGLVVGGGGPDLLFGVRAGLGARDIGLARNRGGQSGDVGGADDRGVVGILTALVAVAAGGTGSDGVSGLSGTGGGVLGCSVLGGVLGLSVDRSGSARGVSCMADGLVGRRVTGRNVRLCSRRTSPLRTGNSRGGRGETGKGHGQGKNGDSGRHYGVCIIGGR